MNHRRNLISLNTDGNDYTEEFKIILNLIDVNHMREGYMFAYRFHQSMELEFGPNWRAICFIVIDVCASSTEERMELLSCLKVNCFFST